MSPSIDKLKDDFSNRHKLVIYLYLLIVILTISLDIYEETMTYHGNEGFLFHFAFEIYLILLSLTGIAYLFHLHISEKKQHIELLQEMEASRAQIQTLKARFAGLKSEFASLLSQQFEEWKLSGGEKEIALMLIKGLSFDEIAEARNTTSKTARKQAVSIYAKAGLKNRNELSAWFLEDML